MPDKANPITRAEWEEWIADRRTQKLLTFVQGHAQVARARADEEKAKFPNESKVNFHEANGEATAFGWVELAILNSGKAPAEPVDDADGARRVSVHG